ASAFNEQFDKDARLALPGVVSRKKQVVPPMQSTFEG
ncbi:DHHA2 domain-containing protein, partial [Lacticaseibacillus paracasei]